MIAEVVPHFSRYCAVEEGVMIWLIVAVLPLDLDLIGEIFRRNLSSDLLGVHRCITGARLCCLSRTRRGRRPLRPRAVVREHRCSVDRVR